jgi:hypothetical protein
MSRFRLVQRIIALAGALAVLALILVLLAIPIALMWNSFIKRGSRFT